MTLIWKDRSKEAEALGLLRKNAIVHGLHQFARDDNPTSAIEADGTVTTCPAPPENSVRPGGARRLVSTGSGLFCYSSYPNIGPLQIWKSSDGFSAYSLVYSGDAGRMASGFPNLIDCGSGRLIVVEYSSDEPDLDDNINRLWGSSDGGDNWSLLFTTAPGTIRHFHSGHYDATYDKFLLMTGDHGDLLICRDVDDLIANPSTWRTRWGFDDFARSTIDSDYYIGYWEQKWRIVVGATIGDYFYWGADTNSAAGVPMLRMHWDTEVVETVTVADHSYAANNGKMVGECWGAGVGANGHFLTIGYGHVPGAPYYGDYYRHLYVADGLNAREIQRSRLGLGTSSTAALAWDIHAIGDMTIVSDYLGFSVSLAGNVETASPYIMDPALLIPVEG